MNQYRYDGDCENGEYLCNRIGDSKYGSDDVKAFPKRVYESRMQSSTRYPSHSSRLPVMAPVDSCPIVDVTCPESQKRQFDEPVTEVSEGHHGDETDEGEDERHGKA